MYFKNFIKRALFHALKNPKYFLIEIFNKFEFLIYLILASPILYSIRLLPKDKRFYLANFRSERLGHFSMGYFTEYSKKVLKINTNKIIYCFDEKISNKFLAKQVRNTFFVNRIVRYLIKICEILPNLDCLIYKAPKNAARDIEGITQKINMPSFTKKENFFCSEWLKSFGWRGPSQKVICLHVRDSAYLNNTFSKGKYKNKDWTYHSYRDTNIDDYSESIKWLLKKGYFIIRTGKVANKRLRVQSKNLVDYPFCNKQNDLIDIWIFANCDLVITTGSGPDVISGAYKIPTIYANLLPIIHSPSWTKSLTCGKHLYWKKEMKHLNLNEYLELSKNINTKKFEELNLVIKDLTSKELLLLIKDGCKYFLDQKPIKKNDLKSTNIFKSYIKKGKTNRGWHKWINKKWIISSNIFDENI